MKFLLGTLFVASVLVFTCYSRSCGNYQQRLESHMSEEANRSIEELPGDGVTASVDLYDTALKGNVASREDAEIIESKLTGILPAGRGRIQNKLQFPEAMVAVTTAEEVSGETQPKGTTHGENHVAAINPLTTDPTVSDLGSGVGETSSSEPAAPVVPLVAEVDARTVIEATLTAEGKDEVVEAPSVPIPSSPQNEDTDTSTKPEKPEDTTPMVAETLEPISPDSSVKVATPAGSDPVVVAVDPNADSAKVADLPAPEQKVEEPRKPEPKVAVEATPEKPSIQPEVVTGIQLVSSTDASVDSKALLEGAGIKMGAPFDPSLVEKLETHLTAQDTIESAKISYKKETTGYRLIAEVTPVPVQVPVPEAPTEPAPASEPTKTIKVVTYTVYGEQKISDSILKKAAALVPGKALLETDLGDAAKRLDALEVVQKVQISEEKGNVQIDVLSQPRPRGATARADNSAEVSIADITISVEDGAKLTEGDALKVIGIKKGDAYHPDHLKTAEKALLAIEGVESAVVVPEYRNGKFYLSAVIRGDRPDLVNALKNVNVYFATGATKVNAAGIAELQRAASAILRDGSSPKIDIAGFADPRGNVIQNQKLSAQRAEAVAQALVRLGVDVSQLSTRANGVPSGNEPLDKQRRVEVRLAPKN